MIKKIKKERQISLLEIKNYMFCSVLWKRFFEASHYSSFYKSDTLKDSRIMNILLRISGVLFIIFGILMFMELV
ncbi:hypothetical protein ACFL5N_00440 [bacterium]